MLGNGLLESTETKTKFQFRCKQEPKMLDFQNNFHSSGKETNEQWNDQLWATDGKQENNSAKVYHLDNQPLNNTVLIEFPFLIV